MKKPRILFIGYDKHLKETILLSRKFDILYVHSSDAALERIAKARWQEHNPIRGLVFRRETLIALGKSECQFIYNFAKESYKSFSDDRVIVITMIRNDQDAEARNAAVSADYCRVDDWKQLEVLLNKLIT